MIRNRILDTLRFVAAPLLKGATLAALLLAFVQSSKPTEPTVSERPLSIVFGSDHPEPIPLGEQRPNVFMPHHGGTATFTGFPFDGPRKL